MSRPKPTVLIEHTNRTNYKTEQVLASEGIWAVWNTDQGLRLRKIDS